MSTRAGQGPLYGMTPAQRVLRDVVCSRARTLNDRLRELGHYNKLRALDSDDVEAVRAWLFTVHSDDLNRPRAASSSLLDDE